MPTPTIGRTVLYILTAADADAINQRRAHPRGGASEDAGHRNFVGNRASEGDICPAVVVRTFGGPAANLQVLLDGNDTYWATSRSEGDGPGFWAWPARV